MDLDARIRRRRRRDDGARLVRDLTALSPVAHPEEPTGRGPVLERLLDHLEPAFEGQLPPNAYVAGPAGAGKTAVVTALFTHLGGLSTEPRPVIHTSTRAATSTAPGFVYVDRRTTTSEFAFYRAVLDAVVDESVPENGVSTDELRRRLHDVLGDTRTGVVVAVDHATGPGDGDPDALVELFAGLPSNVSWLAVGRTPPAETVLTEYTATAVRFEPYRRHDLMDLLATRASEGLAREAVGHEGLRRLAEWADGDAHDALAALFGAADLAAGADADRIDDERLRAGMDAVPRPSAPLGRVQALPDSRRLVLRRLVDRPAGAADSVDAAAAAITDAEGVDLSAGTVRRFLYELAESGLLDLESAPAGDGAGRPPSRLEPRFPTPVFRRLYDLERG